MGFLCAIDLDPIKQYFSIISEMKIHDFSFSSNGQNWRIENVKFDDLNLLVGGSGVGKTRIVSALHLIADIARGKLLKSDRKNTKLDGVDVGFSINFSHLGTHYRWQLKTSTHCNLDFSGESGQPEIISEKLIQLEDSYQKEIFNRTPKGSQFNGQNLPKITTDKSLVSILAEEDSVSPISEAFKRLIFIENRRRTFFSVPFDPQFLPSVLPTLDIESSKEKLGDMPTVLKAYLLRERFPEIFDKIKAHYIEIFPNVKDVRVGISREESGNHVFFEIRENGSENWISQLQISSGMYRVLICIIEVLVAPQESVIIIDEFENSLGINCMPELTDFILDSLGLQFILTSHHPYIINNIPWKKWQIVTGSGAKIRAKKAVDIPALETASSLDKFAQLVDLLAGEDWVA